MTKKAEGIYAKYVLLGCFNKWQMYQIRLGLDVSIYAKTSYVDDQMRQIRLGLEKELDVSIYANPKYNWKQMYQIRKGLEEGIDVSIYANPKYSWMQMKQMYQIRKCNIEELNHDKKG